MEAAASIERSMIERSQPVHCNPSSPGKIAMDAPLVTTDPDVLGGTPVFVGTRVPVRILFEHLEAGDTLDLFLEDFPSVSRELAVAVLEGAHVALVADAHPA
jgi:uncharacterized protein (DUF433 family)